MEPIKLGNMDNIVLRMIAHPSPIILGVGGYGKVITTNDFPGLALKISKDVNVCKEWTHEFNVQSEIYDNYNSSGKSVKVVKPIEFSYIEKDRCFILMQRVCPPQNFDQTIAVHALLGDIEEDKIDEKRGRFLGQQQLSEFIDLERVAVDLGIFLANIHYKLEFDGADLEYILGKRCGSDKKYWINVIDFGMVNKFTEENAALSIYAVPYFPLSDTCEYYDCTFNQAELNTKLSELFENSYISEAKKYGKKDQAIRVLELSK